MRKVVSGSTEEGVEVLGNGREKKRQLKAGRGRRRKRKKKFLLLIVFRVALKRRRASRRVEWKRSAGETSRDDLTFIWKCLVNLCITVKRRVQIQTNRLAVERVERLMSSSTE